MKKKLKFLAVSRIETVFYTGLSFTNPPQKNDFDVLPVVLFFLIPGHCPVVLLQGGGKMMGGVVFRNKV